MSGRDEEAKGELGDPRERGERGARIRQTVGTNDRGGRTRLSVFGQPGPRQETEKRKERTRRGEVPAGQAKQGSIEQAREDRSREKEEKRGRNNSMGGGGHSPRCSLLSPEDVPELRHAKRRSPRNVRDQPLLLQQSRELQAGEGEGGGASELGGGGVVIGGGLEEEEGVEVEDGRGGGNELGREGDRERGRERERGGGG